MTQVKIDDIEGYPSFSHIRTDQWKVKLAKGRDVKIPGVVLRLGSERSGEEREMWKIWYKGVPKVCYGCLQEGHIKKDCQREQITLKDLGCQPSIGETIETAVPKQNRTYTQILRDFGSRIRPNQTKDND